MARRQLSVDDPHWPRSTGRGRTLLPLMPLKLDRTHSDAIRHHGAADYPNECCGILLGRADGAGKEVSEVVPLRNLRLDPARAQELLPLEAPGRESERNRFLIDPLEQLR